MYSVDYLIKEDKIIKSRGGEIGKNIPIFCRGGGMEDALGLGPSGETRESSNLSSDTE